MDRREAETILAAELAQLRTETYEALVGRLLEKQETAERVGASGTRYQVEVQAFWDDKVNGDLRVIASIDDGGWRAFVPLTDSFIRSSDGGFVDE